MKPLTQASLKELCELEDALFSALAKINADDVDQLRRVQKLIAAKRESPPGQEFVSFKRSPGEAITMALTERSPMTKTELFERLKQGGFPFDPVHGWTMFNNNVNKFVKAGKARFLKTGEGPDIPVALGAQKKKIVK